MNAIEILLSQRWIAKGQDKDLYYKIKDQMGASKKFFTEKLGYQIIVNPYVIKLEKMPAKPEPCMGISEFNDPIEYVFLCMILMFLEDKEAEEQFVLSELTEYIQAKYEEESIDWTLFQYRRHLIKVIKFCITLYMLKVNDGTEDNFMSDYEGEVLYENTGTSRYFMRNFTQNILNYTSVGDFAASDWVDVNEDRGIIRRQRVYRKLLMSIGVNKESEEDEDFAYIKNYRNMVAGEFAELFDCELHVHKTSAFLVLGEDCNLGKSFPAQNTISDIILLCNSIIYEKIQAGAISLFKDESAVISYSFFRSMIDECKTVYGNGLIKTYREKTSTEFFKSVKEYMEYYGFIKVEREEKVILNPILGKVIGKYPKDFKAGGEA